MNDYHVGSCVRIHPDAHFGDVPYVGVCDFRRDSERWTAWSLISEECRLDDSIVAFTIAERDFTG